MNLFVPLLTTLFSSFLTNKSASENTSKTNKSNYRIAVMNNEWSERMMNKQMDYNTEMWNMTNEYNDPSLQVERLTKAGINPALAMGNISTGSAQGASSPSLPSPSSATMQPFIPDYTGIGKAVTDLFLYEGKRNVDDENARFLGAQADWYGAKAQAELAEAYQRTRNTKLKNRYQAIQNNWADATMNADYINKIRQNRMLEVSIQNKMTEGAIMSKELAIFDEKSRVDIANRVADTALKVSQKRMTEQSAIHEVQKMIETVARTKGIKISNNIARRTSESLVKKAYYEARPTNSFWQMVGGIGSDIGYSFFGKGR